MPDRIPLRTWQQTAKLNSDEVVEGYFDGRHGEPEPGDNRSFSYWHGWRNGAVDGGHREADEAQRDLAHDAVRDPDCCFGVRGG